jgi:membrane protein
MHPVFSKTAWQFYWKILRASFRGFSDDKGFKLSGSLAYTTIFSLGPLLLLVMSLASIFFGEQAIEGKIFSEINGLLGSSAARQIQELIKNIRFSGKTNFALTISIVTLFIGATGIFIEIQDSLNVIWRVKAKPKRGLLQFIKNRLLSASLIISLGFLLVVSLIINGAIQAMGTLLEKHFSGITLLVMGGMNLILTALVISFLFAVIFKVLPDIKIRWRDVRAGALFTLVLFMAGRYLIGLYIQKTGTGSVYGAAGSVIVILVWVYFTSVILYLGAEFTQAYNDVKGTKIEPADYAVHIEQDEKEKEVAVLPAQHAKDKNKKSNNEPRTNPRLIK